MATKPILSLSAEEERLFSLLSHCCNETTTARVAGGWVRDKLLGNPSDDIDIALDNISGVDFAASVNARLEELGEETHTLGIIHANPEQSKHLETASIRVLGFEIDCVNLRTETYTEDSRIPVIQFGTALEDARRRDFTINSLFYNIRTGEIEDLTGHGLSDLSAGIIRTPLSAKTTFMDDPLRVLRGVRFASRLNFQLNPEVLEAARCETIRLSLRNKVSRERVLKEMEGMVCSNNTVRPLIALTWLHDLDLIDSVFAVASPEVLSMTTEKTSCVLLPMGWITVATNHANNENNKSDATTVPGPCLGDDDGGDITPFVISVILDNWSQYSHAVLVYANTLLCWQQGATSTHSALPLGNYSDNRLNLLPLDKLTGSLITASEMSSSKNESHYLRPLFWCIASCGLRFITVPDKRKVINLALFTLRESLKLDSDTIKHVAGLLEAATSFYNIYNDFEEFINTRVLHSNDSHQNTGTSSISNSNSSNHISNNGGYDVATLLDFRDKVGAAVRVSKELYRTAILLSCSWAIVHHEHSVQHTALINTAHHHHHHSHTNSSGSSSSSSSSSNSNYNSYYFNNNIRADCCCPNVIIREDVAKIVERFVKLQFAIELEGMDRIWELKPLMNGNELRAALGVDKGPLLGTIIEEQLKWQIRYHSSSTEDCITYLKTWLISKNSK